jgi:hypothetical protein
MEVCVCVCVCARALNKFLLNVLVNMQKTFFVKIHRWYFNIYLHIVLYLTVFFSNRDYIALNERLISELLNLNDLDVSSRDLILKYYLDIFLERLRKPWNTSVRIAYLRAEIWTTDLPDVKHECYAIDHDFRAF